MMSITPAASEGHIRIDVQIGKKGWPHDEANIHAKFLHPGATTIVGGGDIVGEDIFVKVKDGFKLRSQYEKVGCKTPLNGPNMFGLKIGPKLEDRFLKLRGIYF